MLDSHGRDTLITLKKTGNHCGVKGEHQPKAYTVYHPAGKQQRKAITQKGGDAGRPCQETSGYQQLLHADFHCKPAGYQ